MNNKRQIVVYLFSLVFAGVFFGSCQKEDLHEQKMRMGASGHSNDQKQGIIRDDDTNDDDGESIDIKFSPHKGGIRDNDVNDNDEGESVVGGISSKPQNSDGLDLLIPTDADNDPNGDTDSGN